MAADTRETLLFGIALGTFFISTSGVLWKILDSKIKIENKLTQGDLEKKDIQIESLQDKLALSVNGLREKFEHFSNRSRGEHKELCDRVSDLENFMTKTTGFEKRAR